MTRPSNSLFPITAAETRYRRVDGAAVTGTTGDGITVAETCRYRRVSAWRSIVSSVLAFGVLSGCAFDSEGLGPSSLGTSLGIGGGVMPRIPTTNGGTHSVSSRAPIPAGDDGVVDGDDAATGGDANLPSSASSLSTSTSSDDSETTNDVSNHASQGGAGGDSGSKPPVISVGGGLDRDPSGIGGSTATDDTPSTSSGGTRSSDPTNSVAVGGSFATTGAGGSGGRAGKAAGGVSSPTAGGTSSKGKPKTSTATSTTSKGGSRWAPPTIPSLPW